MKKDDKVAEAIKEMQQKACGWPRFDENGKMVQCGEKVSMTVALPLIELQKGKIKTTEVRLGIACCEYHSFIAISGQFAIMSENGNPKHLHGPFDQVSLVEHIVQSMHVSGKFQEWTEAKNRAEARAKEEYAAKVRDAHGK